MGMEKYCDRCGKKIGDKPSSPLSVTFGDIAIDYEDVCGDCWNAVYRGLERVLLADFSASITPDDKSKSLTATTNRPTNTVPPTTDRTTAAN